LIEVTLIQQNHEVSVIPGRWLEETSEAYSNFARRAILRTTDTRRQRESRDRRRKKNARNWRDVTCLWWTRLFRANASRVPRTVAIGLRIGVFLMRGLRRSADGRHAVTLIHPRTRLLDEISRDTLTSALRDTLDSVKNPESQLALADWSWRHRGGRAHQRDWPWGGVRIAPHSNWNDYTTRIGWRGKANGVISTENSCTYTHTPLRYQEQMNGNRRGTGGITVPFTLRLRHVYSNKTP